MSHNTVLKHVVQVVRMNDDFVEKEIVCGNSEEFAERTEDKVFKTIDKTTHFTRIIERVIDKQS